MAIRFLLVLVALSYVPGYNTHVIPQQPRDVIVDVDSGVDDYQALVYILNAERRREVVIRAIVLTDGNAELPHVKNNVYRLLEIVGRTTIPVFAGANTTILGLKQPDHWFGVDGFGDLGLKLPSLEPLSKTTAPTGIAQTIMEFPGRINYIALGPLTNLAIALRLYPEIIEAIGDIFIMGGNYNKDKAEFNFLNDPESVHIVFGAAKKPVSLFTFQACTHPDMVLQWRWTVEIENPVWNLNEKAERKLFTHLPMDFNYNSCDPITVAIFLMPVLNPKPELLGHAEVGLSGDKRAKVFFDANKEPKNVKIIQEFDAAVYQEYYKLQFTEVCKLHKCTNEYE